MRYFLGLEVARRRHGILVCQRKFTLDLIATLGLAGFKPTCTPLDTSHKLTSAEYDQANAHGSVDADELLSDPSNYQKLVGKLLYLTMTRADISYAVENLSQFMHKPKKSHLEGAMRVVRYLKNALGLKILLSSQSSDQLIVYCDADWATCPMTRRLVRWVCEKTRRLSYLMEVQKQNKVSRSSAEAEYRSMANAIAEVVWLTGLFKELNVDLKLPVSYIVTVKRLFRLMQIPSTMKEPKISRSTAILFKKRFSMA
ncbi:PREDICTED: uncharacterized protein LOC109232755 [Nicotiana attenuata]|uniref:uncharacterized protein LOC109232755 n=1 Tax=Nicotiana attenuata TaxID=49451 RepID=UPI0009057CA3|nr:PREDICTED: uncharacterized protein LOC109232755 [Nicotiana attenuata]